jgi:hypothetical protein
LAIGLIQQSLKLAIHIILPPKMTTMCRQSCTDIASFNGKLYIYGGGGQNAWVQFSEAPYINWSDRINLNPIEPHGIE